MNWGVTDPVTPFLLRGRALPVCCGVRSRNHKNGCLPPRGWMTAIVTPLRGYTTSAPCGGTFSSRRRLWGGAIVGRRLDPAARVDDRHCDAPAGLHHIRPLRGHLFDKV